MAGTAPDRRLHPANARVAARRLRGTVEAPRFADGEAASVAVPVADLCAAPGGARDRQLLMGEDVTVYERREGWAFVEAARDGYVGYLAVGALGPAAGATHRVAVPATHLYPAPDLKRRELAHLSFGARLRVTGTSGAFSGIEGGHFVWSGHLRPLDAPFADPLAVAALFFGVPYLWGGNSILGIDCSGLVQAAHLACGIPCPGDSDLQRASLGQAVPEGDPVRRGDVLFWKGHAAMAEDAGTLLHATAFGMAVIREPLAPALARIAGQGTPLLARRRATA